MALSSTSKNMVCIKQYGIQLYMIELSSHIYSFDIMIIMKKSNKMNDSFSYEQAADNSLLLCLHAALWVTAVFWIIITDSYSRIEGNTKV